MIRMKKKKTLTVRSQRDYSFWLFNVVMTLICLEGSQATIHLKKISRPAFSLSCTSLENDTWVGFLSYRASDSKVLTSWRCFYRVRKKNGSKYHYMAPVSWHKSARQLLSVNPGATVFNTITKELSPSFFFTILKAEMIMAITWVFTLYSGNFFNCQVTLRSIKTQ